MRAFGIGFIAAVSVAVVASLGLNAFQKTSADFYTTGSARFNQEESVNDYGRQG